MPGDDASEVKEKKSVKEEVVGYAKSFAIALLLAVIFRTVLFEPFHIPSGSMKSNLLVDDYLFVSKYSSIIDIELIIKSLFSPIFPSLSLSSEYFLSKNFVNFLSDSSCPSSQERR